MATNEWQPWSCNILKLRATTFDWKTVAQVGLLEARACGQPYHKHCAEKRYNDYHPVALTSLVMKWFEELVLALNRKGVPPLYINTSFLTGKKVNRGWHFTGPSHRPVTAVSMDVVTYYSSNLNTSYQAGYEAYTNQPNPTPNVFLVITHFLLT